MARSDGALAQPSCLESEEVGGAGDGLHEHLLRVPEVLAEDEAGVLLGGLEAPHVEEVAEGAGGLEDLLADRGVFNGEAGSLTRDRHGAVSAM